MWAFLGPFLIYWLLLFVACFIVVEVAQDQLYDEVTPHAGLKITGGTAILALLMAWLPPSYESMFTSSVASTLFHAIVWFAVFTLIFQFHPPHALGLSLITFALVSGLATMGVDSIMKPAPRPAPPASARPSQPVRQSLAPAASAPAKKEAAP
jgi:hypothetical protein